MAKSLTNNQRKNLKILFQMKTLHLIPWLAPVSKNPKHCSCYHNGRRNLVVPKASSAQENSWVGLATYAWSGFVLECRVCGVIYRSRQHWYGNETPESMDVVHTEISHIWPGTRTLQGNG